METQTRPKPLPFPILLEPLLNGSAWNDWFLTDVTRMSFTSFILVLEMTDRHSGLICKFTFLILWGCNTNRLFQKRYEPQWPSMPKGQLLAILSECH